jgi:hypothetical protein
MAAIKIGVRVAGERVHAAIAAAAAMSAAPGDRTSGQAGADQSDQNEWTQQ